MQRDVSFVPPDHSSATSLIVLRQLRLVRGLVQICSVNDSDSLAMAMFRIWEREGNLLMLIKGMLAEEVRMTGASRVNFPLLPNTH